MDMSMMLLLLRSGSLMTLGAIEKKIENSNKGG